MNAEKQRIAIAEACGWRIENDAAGFFCIEPNDPESGWDMECIPDYLHDLNAMHEAEKIIRSKPNKRNGQVYAYLYESELSSLTGGESIYATAAQRAEAFLKTINLWKP